MRRLCCICKLLLARSCLRRHSSIYLDTIRTYLSFHMSILYIYILYIYIYISFATSITVAVGARTRAWDDLLSLPRKYKSEAELIHRYALIILSVAMHLPLEALRYKITSERKWKFLSTLGRMQALSVVHIERHKILDDITISRFE